MDKEITIIICFARSGGTLLNRLLAEIPNVVVGSEIGLAVGSGTDGQIKEAHIALREQMQYWHDISLESEDIISSIIEANNIQEEKGGVFIVRDWVYNYFKPNSSNNFRPSGRLELVDEMKKHRDVKVISMVRDGIDVYLSLGGDIEKFGSAYLDYARCMKDLEHYNIKYEDLIEESDKYIDNIKRYIGIESESRQIVDKIMWTGDVGTDSRGIKSKGPVKLKRKWINNRMRKKIDACESLREANRLLGYSCRYDSRQRESIWTYIIRSILNKVRNWKI